MPRSIDLDDWSSAPPSPELSPSRLVSRPAGTPLSSRRGSDASVRPRDSRNGFKASPETFDPVMNEKHDIPFVAEFLETDFSSDTWVFSVRKSFAAKGGTEKDTDVQTKFLDERKLSENLKNRGDDSFELVVIPECLYEDQYNIAEDKHQKLSINSRSVNNLVASWGIPFDFFFSLAGRSTDTGTGFRKISESEWDYWCLLPYRAQVNCDKTIYDHENDEWAEPASRTHLNPSRYIHLTDQKVDLHGSQFGVYMRWNADTKRSSAVVVQRQEKLRMQDMRARTKKIEDALKRDGEADKAPLFVLLVYLSRTVRSWTGALFEMNRQLIKYESTMDEDIRYSAENISLAQTPRKTLVTLESMVSHLLRYRADLGRVHNIVEEVLSHLDVMSVPGSRDRDEQRLCSLASKVKSVQLFCDELGLKAQNTATLLSDQIRASDQRIGQNEMNRIQENLSGIQRRFDTQASELQALRRDNADMKRAIKLCMAFIVGALLAAMVSMHNSGTPNSQEQSPWSPWTWLVLTIPCSAGTYIALPYILQKLAQAELPRVHFPPLPPLGGHTVPVHPVQHPPGHHMNTTAYAGPHAAPHANRYTQPVIVTRARSLSPRRPSGRVPRRHYY